MDLGKIIFMTLTKMAVGTMVWWYIEDKKVYVKLLKSFQTDHRKVSDVSYVRWLNRTELD